MSLSTNFGPGLGAEIEYRRERIVEAARGQRRVRRGRGRRSGHAAAPSRTATRVVVPRPAR